MSRIITYPDTADRIGHHVTVIIDASLEDVGNIALFLKTSKYDHDVYLYREDLDHLEWLSWVIDHADHVLHNEVSEVTLQNHHKLDRFGANQNLKTALEYYQNYDNERINNGI
jgi:hypothetical protein